MRACLWECLPFCNPRCVLITFRSVLVLLKLHAWLRVPHPRSLRIDSIQNFSSSLSPPCVNKHDRFRISDETLLPLSNSYSANLERAGSRSFRSNTTVDFKLPCIERIHRQVQHCCRVPSVGLHAGQLTVASVCAAIAIEPVGEAFARRIVCLSGSG